MQCPCRVSYGVSVCAGVSSLRCTFVVVLFTAVRYALEALYVGEVVEYKQLFEIQVGFTSSPLVWLFGDAGGLN